MSSSLSTLDTAIVCLKFDDQPGIHRCHLTLNMGMGIGGNGNTKSHSRPSLPVRCLLKVTYEFYKYQRISAEQFTRAYSYLRLSLDDVS